jgi:hypothetical protein
MQQLKTVEDLSQVVTSLVFLEQFIFLLVQKLIDRALITILSEHIVVVRSLKHVRVRQHVRAFDRLYQVYRRFQMLDDWGFLNRL